MIDHVDSVESAPSGSGKWTKTIQTYPINREFNPEHVCLPTIHFN